MRENTQFESNTVDEKILLKDGEKVSGDDLKLLLDDKMLDDMPYLWVENKGEQEITDK